MTFGVTNEVKPKSNRAPRKPRVSAASLGAGSVIAVAGRPASGRAVPASAGTAANAAVAAGPERVGLPGPERIGVPERVGRSRAERPGRPDPERVGLARVV